jgi:hypothetical protein
VFWAGLFGNRPSIWDHVFFGSLVFLANLVALGFNTGLLGPKGELRYEADQNVSAMAGHG